MSLELKDVRKQFGVVKAVDGVSLEVRDGEFFSLLGPSGCGKTTILRTIAGILQPDAGTIRLKGRDVTGLPNSQPQHRLWCSRATRCSLI